MPWQARGLYRELIDELWLKGELEIDMESLAEVCGCTKEEMENFWPFLSKCFIESRPGFITNETIEEQRTATDKMRVRRKNAGKLGGISKLNSNNEIQASAKQVLASVSKCHIEENRENKKTLPQRFTLRDCELVYDAYPRKREKGDALKAIKKALDSIDDPDPVNNLLRIVQEYARSPAGQRGEFTPYPASWFNAKGYLDDPSEWEKAR